MPEFRFARLLRATRWAYLLALGATLAASTIFLVARRPREVLLVAGAEVIEQWATDRRARLQAQLRSARADLERGRAADAAAVYSSLAASLAQRGVGWLPERKLALEGLAAADRARGSLSGIRAAHEALLALESANPDRYADAGRDLLAFGETARARELLERGMQMDPSRLNSATPLLELLLAADDHAGAADVIRQQRHSFAASQAPTQSAWDGGPGLRLYSEGAVLVGGWRCVGIADGRRRTYEVPLTAAEPGASVRALSLQLDLGHRCEAIELRAVRLFPPRDVRRPPPGPLLSVESFERAGARGAERQAGRGLRLRVTAPTVTLAVQLPRAVPLWALDRVVLDMTLTPARSERFDRLAKRVEAEDRHD